MSKHDYEMNIKLKHNEVVTIVDKETGAVREVKKRTWGNKRFSDDVISTNEPFKKDYGRAWDYVWSELSILEFHAMVKMVLMAKYQTNSLEYLNDKTTAVELVRTLGVSKNKIKEVLKRLYHFGVYRKYEVVDKNKPHTKYWVLNPYLSFSGKAIKDDLNEMFRDTRIAMIYKLDNE
jgi:ribulose bisphosphate carboxylase small subunit